MHRLHTLCFSCRYYIAHRSFFNFQSDMYSFLTSQACNCLSYATVTLKLVSTPVLYKYHGMRSPADTSYFTLARFLTLFVCICSRSASVHIMCADQQPLALRRPFLRKFPSPSVWYRISYEILNGNAMKNGSKIARTEEKKVL
jgi:hypothetical protein